MSHAVPEAARALAAQLEIQFGRDAELANRLADAQRRLARGNDPLWWGLHPDGLAAVYEEHPAPVDVAFAANRSEVLDARNPPAAIQNAHWRLHSAFIDYQTAAEERRQLAADAGELIRQFVDELLAAGWTEPQARNANLHELTSTTKQPNPH